ncbi:hypothetical protein Halha_1122 [Halobacteroides halobius DSM 5150]|uniref:Uncharacterized protein n=1 Tax=Halobacteroides halobius (strain ATCC 35273 / DSM 5150 / MD-1) TaxID=748449 RepID=L0K7R8_HALHC|nr:hypothetical protein Halha_1122 [Halobacteroides halobius DSM 5150]
MFSLKKDHMLLLPTEETGRLLGGQAGDYSIIKLRIRHPKE